MCDLLLLFHCVRLGVWNTRAACDPRSGVLRSGDARDDCLFGCPLPNSSIQHWRMVVIVTRFTMFQHFYFCNFVLWMLPCLGCPEPAPRSPLCTPLGLRGHFVRSANVFRNFHVTSLYIIYVIVYSPVFKRVRLANEEVPNKRTYGKKWFA